MKLMFLGDFKFLEDLQDKLEEKDVRWDTLSPEETLIKLEELIASGEITDNDAIVILTDTQSKH
jgi:hypothetical protein